MANVPSVEMQRKTDQISLALTASSATTQEGNLNWSAIAGIIVTALTTGVTISFYVAESPVVANGGADGPTYSAANQNYAQLYDSTNSAVTQGITAGKAYALPAAVNAFRAVKMVLDAGTATVKLIRKG